MTPDLPHAARRLLASADWKALRSDLVAFAWRAAKPSVRAGRYDMLLRLDVIADTAPEPPPKRTRRQAG